MQSGEALAGNDETTESPSSGIDGPDDRGRKARGPDRDAAIDRMLRTLSEFDVTGACVRTSTEFLSSTVDHPLFRAAKHDTGLIELVRREA
ncbi:MAG TPA: hypothetical protein VGM75_35730 [Pseudonocardiaceae bacterium]